MKKKITLINIISSFILQLATIISYFILPKIILNNFGSEVNGLVSSINQFLNFITLIEGGITGVILANLYKPLVENDNDKVSSILKTAKEFYIKIGLIYIVYSLVLGVTYKYLFKIDFSLFYVFTLTLILSLNLLVQYMFAVTNKTLLTADKKVYIINFTQTIMIVVTLILAYISVIIYPSIHLLKLICGLLYFLQPVVYGIYVNKHYSINKEVTTDNKLISQRWNGFAINIAAFIHMCTDIAVLTVFTDLLTVSIYSIYTLVTNGLRQIINAISNAIVPTVAQSYTKGNTKEFIKKFDLYEYIIFIIVYFLFSVSMLLTIPFVKLYTMNINDANYYQPLFGVLILISEALYIIKFPHLNLSYSANKFKEITNPAFVEAILNIIISILLVSRLGLIGVAIGTIVAMTYRMIFQVKFTSEMVKEKKQSEFYKKLFIFTIGAVIGIGVSCYFFKIKNLTIINWIIHAVIYSIIQGIIYIVISLMFFKKELSYIKNYIKH